MECLQGMLADSQNGNRCPIQEVAHEWRLSIIVEAGFRSTNSQVGGQEPGIELSTHIDLMHNLQDSRLHCHQENW